MSSFGWAIAPSEGMSIVAVGLIPLPAPPLGGARPIVSFDRIKVANPDACSTRRLPGSEGGIVDVISAARSAFFPVHLAVNASPDNGGANAPCNCPPWHDAHLSAYRS